MKAALSNLSKDVKSNNAEAARMMSEVRKSALALKEYREPSKRKAVQFVRQQNIAQTQQMVLVEPPSTEPAVAVPESPAPPREEPIRVGHEIEPPRAIPQASRTGRREPLPVARRTASASPLAQAVPVAEQESEDSSAAPFDSGFLDPDADE